jgi:hypothetical protein
MGGDGGCGVNISVRCTFGRWVVARLQIFRCAAPWGGGVAALLQIIRCAAPLGGGLLRCYKYFSALHLEQLGCCPAKNISLRITLQISSTESDNYHRF